MNKSIIPVTPGLLALLSKESNLPKPFSQEIFLLEVVIAGTSFCKKIEEAEALIVPEKVLIMKREPRNEYDEFAIAIYCDQVKVGYVPAEMNLVCSRLMDAGKFFFCRVVDKRWQNQWLKIRANIYMVE
ncbi:MAG: HIRAN domain-containing protein [Paludibacter sp.]|nr:HIRAN domain-containing protein [Paludibacter sp.]MDD4198968.1 HIRAN domain-containing protein [Paludibacter sp.]MDD4427456.1 HIRAN domain-containing protein [Paludibacter sp.]